jgi:hypothetical protein
MQYTVIGAWLDGEPAVVGVIAGTYEVYGGDEESFGEGLWFTHVTANDVTDAEQAATTDMIENTV